MASVSIKVKFEITVTDNVYYLTMTASNGSGIPNEIFLHKKSDDSFVGICLVEDMYKWPASPTEGKPFYRANTATWSDADPLKVAEEKSNASTSIESLVNNYATASDIIGVEEITYSSED